MSIEKEEGEFGGNEKEKEDVGGNEFGQKKKFEIPKRHNHALVASLAKRRNLRSLKSMTIEEKQIVRAMRAQNVSTSQIWHYLADKTGGIDKLCFSKKDVNNQIGEENMRLVGVDVETTLVYFKKKKEEDHEFFFAIEAEGNGVVKNILWVDGRARRAYAEFGDAVTFDTL